MFRYLMGLCAALLAGFAAALPPAKIYAQELVDRLVAKNPDVAVIAMHVTPKKSSDNVIIASNIGRIGKHADADDLKVIQTGETHTAVNADGTRFEVELALRDANSRTIGALGVVFPYRVGVDKTALQRRAEDMRDQLARRISHVGNLTEPAQFDAAVPTATYGQYLVDQALERHPQVVILALHAQPSHVKHNEIVASNIGRIGKPADEDDLHVIQSGETKLEFNETGDRYEVEQTLVDVSGTVIGAVGVVFAFHTGADTAPMRAEAAQIKAELARRISNADNLIQPYPFDPHYAGRTLAQKILDAALQRHEDVLIMAMHAAAPDKSGYIIAASNIGRIGKRADEDDMGVINSGKPLLEPNQAGNRFEVEIPMTDASQRRVGALSVVFPYAAGADPASLRRRAEAIRDEIAVQVTSTEALFAAPTP